MRLLQSGGHARIAAGIAAAVLLSGSAAAAATERVASGTKTVGPGRVDTRLRLHNYRLELRLMPNRATVAAHAAVALSSRGTPVNDARVQLTYTMVGMGMGMAGIVRVLAQTAPGRYADAGPTLGMSGRWALRVDVRPRHGAPLHVDLVDRMRS